MHEAQTVIGWVGSADVFEGYERQLGESADGRLLLVERWPGEPERAEAAARARAWLDPNAACVLTGEATMVTAPRFSPAHRPIVPELLAGRLAAAGRLVAALHARPIVGCPATASVADLLALAERRVAAGLVAADRFAGALARYTATQLFDLVIRSAVGEPPRLVPTHGSCELHHLYVDDGRSAAPPDGAAEATFDGVDRLALSDPHRDLARLANDVVTRFGPEALLPLFEGYGLPVVAERLDFFALLDELLP